MATNNAANNKTAASGTVLQGQGVGTASDFSTATYPATTTINQVLYSSAANTVSGLATANSAVLATNGSGVPSITATPTVTSITFGSGSALGNYVTGGTYTPTLVGGTVAGTTTYSSQNGYYTRIGNLVFVSGTIGITAATGTGNLTFGALPFTVNSQTAGYPNGSVFWNGSASWPWPAGTTSLSLIGVLGGTTANIWVAGTVTAGNYLQMANATLTVSYSLTYLI